MGESLVGDSTYADFVFWSRVRIPAHVAGRYEGGDLLQCRRLRSIRVARPVACSIDSGTCLRISHMTRLLQEAFAAAAVLPEADQDALASALLDELASEHGIDHAMASRPDVLARLADEAVAEHRAGRTEPLDPDAL